METQTAEPCEECGYDQRGGLAEGACPECGWDPATVVRDSSAMRRWRWMVAIGLLLLVSASIDAARGSLIQRFRDGATGSLPVLNVPAPKVWAVPLLQRSIGYRPAAAGVSASFAAVTVVLAVVLITARPPGEQRATWLRWWVRIGTPIWIGAALGCLLALPGVSWRDDRRDLYYGCLVAVELVATVPLYLYLGVLAARLGDRVAGRWNWLALGTGVLIAAAIGFVLLDEARPVVGGVVSIQANYALLAAVYGAAALGVGAVASVAVIGLLLRAIPIERGVFVRMMRRGPRWLAERWRVSGKVLERGAVLIGIVLLFWSTWTGLETTLGMDRQGLGGSLPYLNFAGPKLWAVPMSHRFGYDGQIIALVMLVAIWLLTWRDKAVYDDRVDHWATFTRWWGVIVTALFLGARDAAGRQGYRAYDITEWAAAATILAEAPVTFVLYLGTAAYAARVGAPELVKPMRVVAFAAVGIMALAMVPLPMSRWYLDERDELRFIIPSGAYAALSVGVGLYAATLWVRLGLALLFTPEPRPAAAGP
ncbi:MAG: hypothetical protein AAF743_03515 [Planctomycetota bacterium]